MIAAPVAQSGDGAYTTAHYFLSAGSMNITINEDLRAYIDPLTPDEYDALERSLLAEGCRDALVLWGDILVDGHNRYGICQKHGLPFNTVQNTRFRNLEDVHLWMIDQHLGRRSVSDFQRGVLALRKKEIVEERQAAARAAKLTPGQVTMIEKIQKQAAPELVAAVRAGTISLNAAAAVAGLPLDEQVAAASGGKEEVKQAAKRVREQTKKPREEASQRPTTEVQALQDRVAQLTAENEYLRGQVAEL